MYALSLDARRLISCVVCGVFVLLRFVVESFEDVCEEEEGAPFATPSGGPGGRARGIR